jgi:hypothetical protein
VQDGLQLRTFGEFPKVLPDTFGFFAAEEGVYSGHAIKVVRFAGSTT